MERDDAEQSAAAQPPDTPTEQQPAASSALPPMPPQPFPGTMPPLDTLLRAANGAGTHLPHRPRRPPMTTERYDERCWTSTRQTNARRALGRDPAVTMYCYINMRNALEDLVPVPGHPTAFLARDAPLAEHVPPVKPPAERPEGTPEYRWPWLDGRFVYVARGRENVARHMREMGGVDAGGAKDTDAAGAADDSVEDKGPLAARIKRKLMPAADAQRVSAWETIRRIEDRVERQEADKLLPGKKEERVLRRAMGFDEDSSENLISLSDAYSNTLQRLHAHIVRIYSPGLKNLARLPQIWTDGTSTQMLDTVGTRLTDASAFKLAGRMWDSLGAVRTQLEERRERRRGGPGEGAGPLSPGDIFGGSQPPAPPLPPLPPAPGTPRSAESGDGAGESADGSSGEVRGGAHDAPPPPVQLGGRQLPPGTQAVMCVVM